MDTHTQPRQPSGTPVGGQFAGKANPECEIELHDTLAPAIAPDQQLYRWISDVQAQLDQGNRPTQITGPFGVHGVTYGEEGGEEFATVGFVLPDGVFAEVEDGTYGELQGLRIFIAEPDVHETDPAVTPGTEPFQDVLDAEGPWSWTALTAGLGRDRAEDLYHRSGGSLGLAVAMAQDAAGQPVTRMPADKRETVDPEIRRAALWFTAQAVRDHFDEAVDDLDDGALEEIGRAALYDVPEVYRAFDGALQEKLQEWRSSH